MRVEQIRNLERGRPRSVYTEERKEIVSLKISRVTVDILFQFITIVIDLTWNDFDKDLHLQGIFSFGSKFFFDNVSGKESEKYTK